MRAQVQIIQFLLFFVLGFSIFSVINSFLASQNTLTQNYLSDYYLEGISSYISTIFTDSIVYCKYCNFSSFNFSMSAKVFDHPYEVNLTSFFVKDLFLNKSFSINSHNLNATYSFQGNNLNSTLYFPQEIIDFQYYFLSAQFNKTKKEIKLL